MYRAGFYKYHRNDDYITAAANASGLAQGKIGPCPEGYCWYVERMNCWSNTAATSGLKLEIFSQPTDQMPQGFTATAGDRTRRQDLSLAANNDVSDENCPIFVPAGYYLVAFWSGFTNLDVVQLSFQIAVHQLEMEVPRAAIRTPSTEQFAHAVPQTDTNQ